VSETLTASRRSHNHEQSSKYSKFQIKGWVNFDANDKTLAEIAEGIEQGDGFLTLMEVLEVDDDLASVGDEEVRECFENIIAARKLLQNVHELPKKLIEEFRAALKTEEEISPKKIVTSIANSSEATNKGKRGVWP
jgi:hypothetical protein